VRDHPAQVANPSGHPQHRSELAVLVRHIRKQDERRQAQLGYRQ
jgi:hypothetical protein